MQQPLRVGSLVFLEHIDSGYFNCEKTNNHLPLYKYHTIYYFLSSCFPLNNW